MPRTKKCEEFRPRNSLKTQLKKYIKNRDIISKYQSGFRIKHLCETTVNYVISEWRAVGKDKRIIAIFFNFKRVFETIDREIILNKLYMYGIRGIALDCFKSYMKRRRQTTKLNEIESNEIIRPQGSILEALLFIIYINDMPSILKQCKLALYADDTLIYTIANSDEEFHENIKYDMKKIDEWLKMNKLKLNEIKQK